MTLESPRKHCKLCYEGSLNQKDLSALEIYNLKVRVTHMYEEINQNGALDRHQTTMMAHFKGLNDVDCDIIDHASKHVNALLCSVLNSSSVKGWKFLHLLQKMHMTNPGFTYCANNDLQGAPTGAIWMTPQMRSNDKLYGSCISIDAMKQQNNDLGRRGLLPSEQNHSSYISAVGSEFVDDPCI